MQQEIMELDEAQVMNINDGELEKSAAIAPGQPIYTGFNGCEM